MYKYIIYIYIYIYIYLYINIYIYNNCSPKSLPTHTDNDLCNLFSNFYINKLSEICSTISNTLLVLYTSYDLTFENYSYDNYFHYCCSVSNVKLYNVIITLKYSSPLDPLPISLFHNLAYFLTILYLQLLTVLLELENN